MMPIAAMRLRRAAAGSNAYFTTLMALNPLGYWRVAETVGATAVNAGSATAPGTYFGTMTRGLASLVNDPSDFSLSMGGGNIDIGSPAALKLASNFTYLGAIVVPTAGTDRTILSYANGGFCMRLDTSNRLQAVKSFVAARGNTSSAVGTAGQVVLVGIDVDAAGVLTFYVQGASAGTGTTASDYGTPLASLKIGSDHTPAPTVWSGGIDELAILSPAIGSSNHAALFAASGI